MIIGACPQGSGYTLNLFKPTRFQKPSRFKKDTATILHAIP
jgi:hypothetical protein